MKQTAVWLSFVVAGLPLCTPAYAGGKKSEVVLPAYVLQARTVAVVIAPDAGRDPNDPDANRRAQRAVEAALSSWGRYQIVFEEMPT